LWSSFSLNALPVNLKVMKIGIFGGSFNPIHFGHLRLAEWIVKAGYVDTIWLMVSPQNPLKVQSGLMPETLRYEMARKACESVEGVEACDIEFRLERPNFTWRTLEALREAYPEHEFALVIGEDNWVLFEKWSRYSEILASTELLVYPRGEVSQEGPVYLLEGAKGVSVMQGAPLFPFSSTEVRDHLKAGLDVSEMVPRVVVELLRMG
jgi:nicotinate-nucleotide adenylyltransferase